MTELLVRSPVTPESAGWEYVGFEVVNPPYSGHTGQRELCLVVVQGSCDVRSKYGEWRALGGRATPF
jgi:5-deoxy-glucuronate isomerase